MRGGGIMRNGIGVAAVEDRKGPFGETGVGVVTPNQHHHGPHGQVVVLKFGSSILDGPAGFRDAAAEVVEAVERGRRVVTVVSAVEGTTDALLSSVASLSRRPPDGLVSRLLATGESASVALFAIALAEAGVAACPLSAEALGLRTTGPTLDAEPHEVGAGALRKALERYLVVVVPGFVGVDAAGDLSLLGRGGSDLTALFVAHSLGAEECRLLKDVDGIHDRDPGRFSSTRRLERATWEQALQIGGDVVQDKALRWASSRGLVFRVASVGGTGTIVGEEPAHAAVPTARGSH